MSYPCMKYGSGVLCMHAECAPERFVPEARALQEMEDRVSGALSTLPRPEDPEVRQLRSDLAEARARIATLEASLRAVAFDKESGPRSVLPRCGDCGSLVQVCDRIVEKIPNRCPGPAARAVLAGGAR